MLAQRALFVPEKRPSVTSAVEVCKPMPYRYFIALYISTIPGPPLGPSYLMTTTFLSLIFPSKIAWLASSSESNTTAVPVNCLTLGSIAVGLLIPVFGARFPLSTAKPPETSKGSSIVLMISLFSGNLYW